MPNVNQDDVGIDKIKVGANIINWKHSNNYLDEIKRSRYYNLTSINRYSNKHFILPESTATHTIEMQLLALWISDRLLELGVKLDNKELIYRCLVHDLDESVMCDIPRDIKYHDNEILTKINEIAKELLIKSEITEERVTEILEAKHGCIEGELVGFLDVLQAFIKIESEYRLQSSPQLMQMLVENSGYLIDKLDAFTVTDSTFMTFMIMLVNDVIDSVNKLTGLSLSRYSGSKLELIKDYMETVNNPSKE